jgi:D-alanine-D-alanine ligase
VLFGGPSPEHDISVLTGLQAVTALTNDGIDVTAIYWAKTGEFYEVGAKLDPTAFVEGVPRGATRLDLIARPGAGFSPEAGRLGRRTPLSISAIVNCCHGGPGEDGTLQAALDLAGLRYTGPSAAGAALGMDKLAFAGTMMAAGIAALPRQAFTAGGPHPSFNGPYIIKPRFGGSSIGIEITDDPTAAAALVRASPHYRGGAVVEPYLADAIDVNIAVLTHPEVRLSGIERPLRTGGDTRIYSYADKYLGGEGMASAKRELPAALPAAVVNQIHDAARAVVSTALVRSVARLDFLLVGDEVFVNEINTIPGSLAWYFWSAEGLPFPSLLSMLLSEALACPTAQYSTEGADGIALRSAGSIAAKLA